MFYAISLHIHDISCWCIYQLVCLYHRVCHNLCQLSMLLWPDRTMNMKHSVESFGDLVVCDDPPSLCPNSLQLVQHCKKRGISQKKVLRRAKGGAQQAKYYVGWTHGTMLQMWWTGGPDRQIKGLTSGLSTWRERKNRLLFRFLISYVYRSPCLCPCLLSVRPTWCFSVCCLIRQQAAVLKEAVRGA